MKGLCAAGAVIFATGCVATAPRAQQPISLDRVPLCYNGGRAVRTTFEVSEQRWGELAAGFDPPSESPAQERERIRAAVAMMEKIAGGQTPTHLDRGKNRDPGPNQGGQLDCIDESTNTDVYLRLFQQRGLLRWHEIESPVWRAPYIFDTHRTAVIRDITDGRRYAVDSWYLDNGEPPFIQELSAWKRKAPIPGL